MKFGFSLVFAAALCATSAKSAVLTHQWTLNGTTADTFGGTAMVLPNSGALGATGYNFTASNGLSAGPNVSGALSTNNYSIEMLVRLDSMGGYKKLIDFKNLSSDRGFYFLNGQSNFYPFVTSGSIFGAGADLHLVATRNSVTNIFNFYVNGALQLTLNDSGGEAIFSALGAPVHLMRDDIATGGVESTSGFLNYVRFYDGALTGAEVAGLSPLEIAGPTPAPAPAALALLGLGLVSIGLLRRR